MEKLAMEKIAEYKDEIYKIAGEKMRNFVEDRVKPAVKENKDILKDTVYGGAKGANVGAGLGALYSIVTKGGIKPVMKGLIAGGALGSAAGSTTATVKAMNKRKQDIEKYEKESGNRVGHLRKILSKANVGMPFATPAVTIKKDQARRAKEQAKKD
jgi:hypothetical protein